MAETVGGVSYSVDVDYGDLNQLDAKIDQVGKSAKQSFGGIDYTVKKAQASMGNLNKTSAAVSNAFKVQKGAAQQLSFQLQDVVVQAQMGTNAFTIIAQQAPQILSLAGAVGALLGVIVALAAAAGGVFYKAFSDSSDAVKTLDDAVKMLGDSVEITDDGVATLTEEIRRLAAVSQDAAMAQLAQEIIDAKNVINSASKEIKQSYSDLTSGLNLSVITTQIERYEAAITQGGEAARIALKGITQRPDLETKDSYAALEQSIRQISKEFSISREQAFEFIKAVSSAAKGGDAQAIQDLQNLLSALSRESGFTNAKLAELQNALSAAFSEARNAGDIMQAAQGFINNFGSALEESERKASKTKSTLDSLIASLKDQAFTYGMTQRGIALYTAEQLGANEVQKETIKAYFDAIEAAEQDIETKKKSREKTADQIKEFDKLKEKLSEQILELQDSEAALEAYIQKQRDLAVSTGRNADEIESLIRLQRQLKEEQKQQKVDKKRDDRVARLEEEIRLQQVKLALGNDEFEIQSAIAALGKDATAGEIERITALITQMQALRLEAELIGPALQQSFNQTVLSSLDQLSQGLANIILNGASARDVIGNLAGTIATELLSSIIRYYAGQAAAAVLGIGAATTAGTAQAAALTAAYTPAAIAANIATFGAAATAAAATAPIAATATIGAISSGSLGGGRLYGGPVSAGKMYPITENGKPEILQQGAKQYLLPGSKGGNVVSNRDMQQASGGMNVQINVQNNTPSNVDVQRRQGPDKTEIIDIVVADIKGRGKTLRAITDTTTASNKL